MVAVGVDFRAVEYKDLITFLQGLRLKKLSPATVQTRLSAVSSWYDWLKRIRVVKDNPCDMVSSIQVPDHQPKFFTQEEYEKLLAGTKRYRHNTERNVAMLEFIYASGCRRAEVSRLNAEDLFLGSEMFASVKMGKGGNDRLALLADRFALAWNAYLPVRARALARWERPQEKAAFVTHDGKRMAPETIYYTIKRLCKYAGVRELYPHAIRHTAATHMLNNGADLLDIKEQLGHKSLSTTQVYLHVALERRRERYRKSHPAASSPPASSDTSGPD